MLLTLVLHSRRAAPLYVRYTTCYDMYLHTSTPTASHTPAQACVMFLLSHVLLPCLAAEGFILYDIAAACNVTLCIGTNAKGYCDQNGIQVRIDICTHAKGCETFVCRRVLPMMNRFSPGIMFVYNTSCDSERRCRGHALALTRPYLRH